MKTCKRCSKGLAGLHHRRIYCRECSGIMSTNKGGRDVIRAKVRLRDRETCQNCGKTWSGGRAFDVHHMNLEFEGLSHHRGSYTMDLREFDNMVTLCHACHMRLHYELVPKCGLKLSPSDRQSIKQLKASKTHAEIAKLYNISTAMVSFVMNGRR